jgi:predicted ATPase
MKIKLRPAKLMPWKNVINGIEYKNFKAFDVLKLDPKPITILLGPNNSGKSSILAGPKLLTQTTESFDSHVTLLLNGIFGDYGTYRDVVFQNQKSRPMEIIISLRHSREPIIHRSDGSVIEQAHVQSRLRLEYKYRSKLKQIILNEVELVCNSTSLLRTKYSTALDSQLITYINGQPVPPSSRTALSRRLRFQHFFPQNLLVFGNKIVAELVGGKADEFIRVFSKTGRSFYRALENLEYVGALRAAPARAFLFSGETRERVGANGEHAINIMMMDSLRGGSKRKGIQNRVVAWLKKSGIAGDLKVHSLSDRHYEIHVRHPVTGEFSNFADVGYGNSQVIPVLIAGYNLRPGDTLLTEQPEIHLHPKAQAELGDFFCDLYEMRVQSFVETHSEHLVLRLQQQVAKGAIPHNDIVFYYVYANGKRKHLAKMTLDRQGRFRESWPEGFFPERLEEAKKLSLTRMANP